MVCIYSYNNRVWLYGHSIGKLGGGAGVGVARDEEDDPLGHIWS